MKVPYFKKQKMYKIVSELLPDMEIPKQISTEYRFYRGSEWLDFSFEDICYTDSYVFVSLYHSGYSVVLDLEYRHFSEFEDPRKFKVIKRCFWLQPDGSLKLEYESEYNI